MKTLGEYCAALPADFLHSKDKDTYQVSLAPELDLAKQGEEP